MKISSWTATDCQITLTRPEGTVGQTAAETEPMTYVDAVNFIKSLSPATLGLKADSLADYSVYPMQTHSRMLKIFFLISFPPTLV